MVEVRRVVVDCGFSTDRLYGEEEKGTHKTRIVAKREDTGGWAGFGQEVLRPKRLIWDLFSRFGCPCVNSVATQAMDKNDTGVRSAGEAEGDNRTDIMSIKVYTYSIFASPSGGS